MRKLIAICIALFALSSPATALAHNDFKSVTLTGDPWSATYVSSSSLNTLGCWDTVGLGVGQTKYVRNNGDEIHYGLGTFVVAGDGSWHVHNNWTYDSGTTGETRFFYSSTDRSDLSTRRVWYPLSGTTFTKAIKFVNNGVTSLFVRGNC